MFGSGNCGASLGSKQKLFWGAQQNLATGLNQSALSLPLADQPAGSEMSNVGRLRQLFIRDVQLHASGNLVSDTLRQIHQDGGKPLRRGVAGKRHMGGNIESKVLCAMPNALSSNRG